MAITFKVLPGFPEEWADETTIKANAISSPIQDPLCEHKATIESGG